MVAFITDLLQLFWQISCTMTFDGLMSAQGWLWCKTHLATCEGTAKLPFFTSSLFLSAMEHASISCSLSSWFEGKNWTKVAPFKIFFHCCGLIFITKNFFIIRYFLEKGIIISFQIFVWRGWRVSLICSWYLFGNFWSEFIATRSVFKLYKTTSFKWRSICPCICLNSSGRSEYLWRSRIGDFKQASTWS